LYEPTDETEARAARYFEKYLDDLYARGIQYYFSILEIKSGKLVINPSTGIFVYTGGSEEEETLGDLLRFWTGWPSLPMVEYNNCYMKVTFLPAQATKVLAESDTCFTMLKIPTYHNDYREFLKHMDISVSYGKVGFGKM